MCSRERKHLLLITISGYGHIIPMVALARRLLLHHKVTLALPAFFLEYVKRKGEFPSGFEEEVEIIGIDNGIPLGTGENEGMMQEWFTQLTIGAPRLEQFLLGMTATKPEDHSAVQTSNISGPVDLVIGDVFLTKPLAVLARRSIPYYLFICSALGAFGNLLYITPNTQVAEKDTLPPFRLVRLESEGSQPAVEFQTKELALSINMNLGGATGMIVNSFREIDHGSKEIMSDPRMKHLDFFFVGPLMPEENSRKTERQHVLEEEVKAWLNQKPDRSVTYVSFGGYSQQYESRIALVAEALLKQDGPFIFALREEQHSLLPRQLRGKATSNHPDSMGLVLHWAPQKVVLAHPAVKVFLSHGGWNSTMETVLNGQPMVAWPRFGDQLENALWVQEAGIGVSLIQGDARTSGYAHQVTADAVVEAIKEASEACVTAAEEWQKKAKTSVAPGGSAYENLNKLLSGI